MCINKHHIELLLRFKFSYHLYRLVSSFQYIHLIFPMDLDSLARKRIEPFCMYPVDMEFLLFYKNPIQLVDQERRLVFNQLDK